MYTGLIDHNSLGEIMKETQQEYEILLNFDPADLFDEIVPYKLFENTNTIRFHSQLRKPDGFPQIPPPIESIQKVADFWVRLSDLSRTVIVGSDCHHEDLEKFGRALETELLSFLEDSKGSPKKSNEEDISRRAPAGRATTGRAPTGRAPTGGVVVESHFVSKDWKIENSSSRNVHTGLFLDTNSIDNCKPEDPPSSENIISVCLQLLLGGGKSFSSGGPGKGLFSRLNTRGKRQLSHGRKEYPLVLPLAGVDSCRAAGYKSGWSRNALGIIAEVDKSHANECREKLMIELESMNKLTSEEFNRVKNQLKFTLWSNLGVAENLTEEIAKMVMNKPGMIRPKFEPLEIHRVIDCLRKSHLEK